MFIIDIKQMASGRMEMDSTNIFHYTGLLAGLLILKKTRDTIGAGWGKCRFTVVYMESSTIINM